MRDGMGQTCAITTKAKQVFGVAVEVSLVFHTGSTQCRFGFVTQGLRLRLFMHTAQRTGALAAFALVFPGHGKPTPMPFPTDNIAFEKAKVSAQGDVDDKLFLAVRVNGFGL